MNLSDWLKIIHSHHFSEMDLSLERVMAVAKKLFENESLPTIVTVGGTNGKGSCVAGFEAIYQAAGFRVGAFTSPVLFRHTEYIRVLGKEISEDKLCLAFEKINQLCDNVTLTPFEFTTVAAFEIFLREKLDVWVLEVGLGGRFDAVNAVDADLSVIASIGIDHVEWLGETREEIAYEKAGIFREKKPAICGDLDPPNTLIDYAKQIKAPLYRQNIEFGFKKTSHTLWTFWNESLVFDQLPIPTLALTNMACVVQGITLLKNKLPVEREALEFGLKNLYLTGRIEVIPGEIQTVFDVAHNPASAEFLANWLQENPISGRTYAVFSMLKDKDIPATIKIMDPHIHKWFIAGLACSRGCKVSDLEYIFKKMNISENHPFDTIQKAFEFAQSTAKIGDRVLVFGSFHTVASVMEIYHPYS